MDELFMKPRQDQIEAAAEMMWNLHAQTKSWDELNEVSKDQMRSEARTVLEVVPL